MHRKAGACLCLRIPRGGVEAPVPLRRWPSENRIAAPADKYKNRPPINPAKLLERVARLLLFALRVSSGKDQAPPSSGELTRLAGALLADLRVHKRPL